MALVVVVVRRYSIAVMKGRRKGREGDRMPHGKKNGEKKRKTKNYEIMKSNTNSTLFHTCHDFHGSRKQRKKEKNNITTDFTLLPDCLFSLFFFKDGRELCNIRLCSVMTTATINTKRER